MVLLNAISNACFRTKSRYLQHYFSKVSHNNYKFLKRCALSAMINALLVAIVEITRAVI